MFHGNSKDWNSGFSVSIYTYTLIWFHEFSEVYVLVSFRPVCCSSKIWHCWDLQDICCHLECGREGTQSWHEPGRFLDNGRLCRYLCVWVWLTQPSVFIYFILQWEDVGACFYIGYWFPRFQEIVPLNAGNVLVIEDNEPAAKWLALINHALNKPDYDLTQPSSDASQSSKHFNTLLKDHFFYKPSLKVLSRNFRAESSLLKTCNCPVEPTHVEKRGQKKLRDIASKLELGPLPERRDGAVEELAELSGMPPDFSSGQMGYRLVASKQMVGIFLSIWARTELVPYIAHLRVSCIGTGILGRLGNKVSKWMFLE